MKIDANVWQKVPGPSAVEFFEFVKLWGAPDRMVQGERVHYK